MLFPFQRDVTSLCEIVQIVYLLVLPFFLPLIEQTNLIYKSVQLNVTSMTLIFIFTLFASIKTYICTYKCRSWIVCTYPKVGLIYYSLFTVCLHLFLLNICTCICVYALVFIIHLFSRNAVTFNLIGFVSPLA